jgi:hypothetical protein
MHPMSLFAIWSICDDEQLVYSIYLFSLCSTCHYFGPLAYSCRRQRVLFSEISNGVESIITWKPVVLCCYLVLYLLIPFDAPVTLTLKVSSTGIVYLVLNVIHPRFACIARSSESDSR